MKQPIILASNSPRRRQLLSLMFDSFRVQPSDVDETFLPQETPQEYVLRVAEEKARSVGKRVNGSSLIIAADTTVMDGDEILGKPADAEEAAQTLRRLRGRTHQVLTGLVVFRPSDEYMAAELVVTDVPMRNYSDQEIQQYIATGDPFDKAGAYAIQNEDFHPVPDLGGCFANVMGFPICNLMLMLEKFGVTISEECPLECQKTLAYACPVFQSVLTGNA
ncbi:MAG: Maf family protein [Chloroflexota bacterium]|nr:Maf family protein [Chloroflexota bacterium]